MANLETHPKLVGAVVQQQNREDAIIDDRADQLRGANQQGFEIERGIERVSQADEIVQVRRLHADVHRIEMGEWVGRGRDDSRLRTPVPRAGRGRA